MSTRRTSSDKQSLQTLIAGAECINPVAAAAAAAAAGTPAGDATLTTRCLLEYCAQYPQHKQFVKNVLLKDGSNLEHLAGSPFAADKDCVIAAVSNCGAALQFAAPQLRSDRDVVLHAVQNDPFSLGFASQTLRADPGVVLAALRLDPAALALADSRLFSSAAFMLAAIKLDATAATYAAPELLSDPYFRAAAKAANSVVGHWFVNTEHFPGLQDPAVQQEFEQPPG
jgi:hypothetical protein